MTTGWQGGEERGYRLDGPREAAQVTVGRPGFESSSRAWVCRLGQVSPSVSRSSNGCEDHRNTGRAVGSVAAHTGLQQTRPLLPLTGWWRGGEAALYFSCRSVHAPAPRPAVASCVVSKPPPSPTQWGSTCVSSLPAFPATGHLQSPGRLLTHTPCVSSQNSSASGTWRCHAYVP